VAGASKPYALYAPCSSKGKRRPALPRIAAIRLIQLGVATHSTNMDQRLVGLAFNPTDGSWQVSAPANANVAPPGLHMLFALRPKSASTSGQTAIPSVAKIVQVKKP
jgi:hypothetical protein